MKLNMVIWYYISMRPVVPDRNVASASSKCQGASGVVFWAAGMDIHFQWGVERAKSRDYIVLPSRKPMDLVLVVHGLQLKSLARNTRIQASMTYDF